MTCELSAADATNRAIRDVTLRYLPSLSPTYPIRPIGAAREPPGMIANTTQNSYSVAPGVCERLCPECWAAGRWGLTTAWSLGPRCSSRRKSW